MYALFGIIGAAGAIAIPMYRVVADASGFAQGLLIAISLLVVASLIQNRKQT
jgi:Tfp pilus assembly major pilin PilA